MSPTTDDYDKHTEQQNRQTSRSQRIAKLLALMLMITVFILLCALVIFTIQKF